MTLKEIVKNNVASFSFYRQGHLYYRVSVGGAAYTFPIAIADLQTATIGRVEKAITLMQYIRKALNDKTFVAINNTEGVR